MEMAADPDPQSIETSGEKNEKRVRGNRLDHPPYTNTHTLPLPAERREGGRQEPARQVFSR
jgi:hypothetical protein